MNTQYIPQKRVLAVHDISCFGRCSLTVALPIISASGAECTVMPTAVLSTHTGGFSGFTFRDLTDDMQRIAAHWEEERITFDCVYTGYLGSYEQLDIVKNIIRTQKSAGARVVIDPVMGDGGKLYGAFSRDFAAGMASLCADADIITPNLTEAAFMLNSEYRELPFTREFVSDTLKRLLTLGCRSAVLTGIAFDDDTLGAAAYDGDEIYIYTEKRVNGMYHGTGDVFASALCGAYVNGHSLADSTRIAVMYTAQTIRRKYDDGTDYRYGVPFEQCLDYYIELLK